MGIFQHSLTFWQPFTDLQWACGTSSMQPVLGALAGSGANASVKPKQNRKACLARHLRPCHQGHHKIGSGSLGPLSKNSQPSIGGLVWFGLVVWWIGGLDNRGHLSQLLSKGVGVQFPNRHHIQGYLTESGKQTTRGPRGCVVVLGWIPPRKKKEQK